MFYVLIFSILAVVLIVGGLSAWSRSRRAYEDDEVAHATQSTHSTHAHNDANRQTRKAKRAQSRHERRKH
jgi:3-mercaptopyruvate sulfurtransferase SseA